MNIDNYKTFDIPYEENGYLVMMTTTYFDFPQKNSFFLNDKLFDDVNAFLIKWFST